MKLYSYCSYDGSPTGFRLGVCERGKVQGDMCALTESGIDPFVRACFVNGMVHSGLGKIPNREKESYFLLVKKLVDKQGDSQFYINLAVTADKWREIESMLNGDLKATEKLIAQKIIPMEGDKFGYHLKADIWDSLEFGNLCGYCEEMQQHILKDENLYLKLRTVQIDNLQTLTRQLGLDKQSLWCLSPYKNNVVCYRKKCPASKQSKILCLLAVIMVLILIMAFLFKNLFVLL